MKKLVYILKKINLYLFFLIIIFIFIFSRNIIVNAYDDIKTTDNKKIICEVDIDDDFDIKTIIVVLKSNFSQYSGISTDVLNKLLYVNNVSDIEDLSEVPKEYLIDSKTLITSETETVLHLKSIQFKQILKLHLNVKTKDEVIKIIKEIELFNEVLYVGPNYFCKQESIMTNDTYIDEQWSFNSLQGIHIFDAWDFSQGSSEVRVGIIDSGISVHNDLNENVVGGFDYYNDNDNTIDDEVGHGTNVAGIIGALGNNNMGISGVCQNVSMVPIQTVYDSSDSGYHDVDSVIEAIEDARDMWNTENRISVINYSIAGFGRSPDILAAIEQYQGLFVWAAGNQYENLDLLPNIESYNLENLISVGAVDINNNLSVWLENSGSNYGNAVNVYAPGTDILTTNLTVECEWDVLFPDGYRLCELHDEYIEEYFRYINEGVKDSNGEIIISPNNTEIIIPFFNNLMRTRQNIFSSHHLSDGYHTVSGTSFATPHVSGVAALLLSVNENLSASQLKQAILDSADEITITVPDTSEGADEDDTVTQNVLKINAYEAIKEVLINYTLNTNCSLNSNTNINLNKTINSNGSYFDELNGFYELNVSTSQYYNFNITSNNSIDVKLFDDEMNEINFDDLELTNSKVNFKHLLYTGKYYLLCKYSDRETTGTINVKINVPETENVIIGNNNVLLTYLYGIDDYVFNNNLSGGFYKITLNATNSSGTIEYPEGCIKVYEDETKQQLLTRLETIYYTLDAETDSDSNNLVVFLEYGQSYYINIDLPDYSYSSMNIDIERLSNTYNIVTYNNAEEHVILEENTTAYGDFIQRVEILEAGRYTITFIHDGPQSEGNLSGQQEPNYLYYVFYKEVSSPAEQYGDLELVIPHMATTVGNTVEFTYNLQPGVYYIGYHNKLNNEPISISISCE